MNKTLTSKLEQLLERYEELGALLSDNAVINDQHIFRGYAKEYAELEPVVLAFRSFEDTKSGIADAQSLQKDSDPEIRALAEEEIADLSATLRSLNEKLQQLLLPRDPNDASDVFLEIRAGTGGDEAAIFAGDLFKMYTRFAESKNWRVEILSERPGDHGGFKEIISRIEGKEVYSQLKFESGTHRVQRIPQTESQGRRHTSACTVAILPEISAIEEIEINKSDLRVDTYRASGAGGQHVNKTDSAVRLTHIPSGIVVECQDERSQHKNKAKAMSLLHAKLLDQAQRQQREERSETRRILVGSGDRSEKIRTYNFPQGRITDHRINLSLYRLNDVISGALELIINPLIREHQADLLASLSDSEG